jgi:hypothetical protein
VRKDFYRSTIKALVVILLLSSLVSFVTPKALAFDGAENKNNKINDRASTNDANGAVSESVVVDAKPATIDYTSIKNSTGFESASRTAQPEAAFRQILRVNLYKSTMVASVTPAETSAATPKINLNTVSNVTIPMPAPQSKQPLTKIPLTVGEKFGLFFKGSFLSIGPYANAAFSGVRGEAFDKDHDPNGDHGNYFADAGTRAARSFAFGATSKFFERFAYASIFRQDPRYHRSEKKGAGARVGYAVSRVFITEGDKGGNQFNISFLGGGLTAAYISKTWEREERKTTGKVLSKWGNHVLISALSNVLREFLAGQ